MTDHITHLMGELNTIVLATDGSSYSDSAVQEAIFFGQSCGAKLIVLNVISIDAESGTSAHSIISSKRRETKEYINNIEKMAADSGITCEVVIEDSYQPDKTIVDVAHKYEADVIIMGRHGKKGPLKFMGGNLTSKVIGRRFPQVLVVPRNYPVNSERILLATDGSEFGQMALDEALSMSKHCSTLQEVYVLSVASKEAELDNARKLAETVCETAQKKKVHVSYSPMAQVGRTSDIILSTAKEKDVGMIIVGGHGKGLSKLLMGHVTERVIDRAHCAVLVIEKDK
jgi:nucleotide-binding universal stress UspA family protein